jgi:Rod binding domain-containing protein
MDITQLIKLPAPETLSPGKDSEASGSRLALKDMKLKKACADFEGVLLNYLFEAMRKTVGEGGVFGKSFQKDMYESMFTQEVSTSLARGKGMGIGEALYRQVSSSATGPRVNSYETLAKSASQEKESVSRYK